MKTVIGLSLVVAIFLSGCAFPISPVGIGFVYTDVKGPVNASSAPKGSKQGQAESMNVLGIVATGDSSIQTAAASAGITKISHVDFKSWSILGLFSKFTTYVYGD